MENEGKVDAIITSPPYAESVNAPNDPRRRAERMRKAGLDPKTIVGGKARCGEVDWKYGESEEQIGNLPHGKIDAVITSPPYADGSRGSSRRPLWDRLASDPSSKRYRRKKHPTTGEGYSESEDNIGNLPLREVDAIITSPPYEASLEGSSRHTRGGIASRDPALAQTGTYHQLDISNPYKIARDKHWLRQKYLTEKRTIREIAAELRVSPTCIRYNLHRYNIRPLGRWQRQFEMNFEDLDNDQKQILLGTLLGDGSVEFSEDCENARLKLCQKSLTYLKWKLNWLQPFFTMKPSRSGRDPAWRVSSVRHPLFTKLYEWFYEGGRKRVTKDILDKLNELGLSVWFMDDGFGIKGEGKIRIGIATDPFTKEGINLIISWFQERFNVEPKLNGRKGKDQYQIFFNVSDSERLIKIIEPYVLPEFTYKIMKSENGKFATRLSFGVPVGYSPNKENIGNLKSTDGEYEALEKEEVDAISDVNIVLTSPPYSSGGWKADENPANPIKREQKRKMVFPMRPPHPGRYSENPQNVGNLPHGEIDAVITSPPYADSRKQPGKIDLEREVSSMETDTRQDTKNRRTPGRIRAIKSLLSGYSESEENIGNLRLGEVDAVITSPPYAIDPKNICHTKEGKTLQEYDEKRGFKPTAHPRIGYSQNEDNIGNLPHREVDTIITSPPYGHEATASKPTKLEEQGEFQTGHSKEKPYTEEDYRTWDRHEGGNIAKRKLFIRVPCSPEEAEFHDTRPRREGTIWEFTKEVEATQEVIKKVQKLKDEKKGKSETYLEAMLRVYSECYKVLKPGGYIIIIVKPFVRNKKPVDLPYHTWLLLEKCGFKLVDVLKFKLPTQSFWRVLQYRNNPELERISHEYILVCQK